VDIGGLVLTDLYLNLQRPEVLIRPAVHHIGLVDRIDVESVIMTGELAALAMLPQIRAVTLARKRSGITKFLARWIIRHYPSLLDELLRNNYGP
jgi:hypothetical protein